MRVRLVFLLLLGLFGACTTPGPMLKSGVGEDPLAARRVALALRPSWSFSGRVAVSDGKDSGSARISWQQEATRYRVTLRLPVSGETWRLSGDELGCVLEGARSEPVRGRDPEELLRRELGWRLPVGALGSWARALSAKSAESELALGADGLPAVVLEAGWRVQYRDYDRTREPPLPTRIDAERPPYTVRLAIASWGSAADAQ
jgi:outer membrane lipoprotein LolB